MSGEPIAAADVGGLNAWREWTPTLAPNAAELSRSALAGCRSLTDGRHTRLAVDRAGPRRPRPAATRAPDRGPALAARDAARAGSQALTHTCGSRDRGPPNPKWATPPPAARPAGVGCERGGFSDGERRAEPDRCSGPAARYLRRT